ncbi:MAG: winged helix-turn-helix transcriptional regulator [bacterium]|nr:winged helix-turn-helix transcriptional regulator [bacterium]
MAKKTETETITGTKENRKRVLTALKALSNENRLTIFERLRAGEHTGELNEENRLSVCSIADNFDMSLSTISHHIKELRLAGLVDCERNGQTIL